jgi:hypothetical protein
MQQIGTIYRKSLGLLLQKGEQVLERASFTLEENLVNA